MANVVDVIMPQLGFDMQEGTIQRWLKQVGDRVERGEPLAEVETEKATLQVESYNTGTLTAVTKGEGETVPVGDKIGEITED